MSNNKLPDEYYISVPVTKFGDLPPVMTEVVIFFRNRKEPFVGYREIENNWCLDTGEGCKTPTHWLKKVKK